jgi:cytochrome c oxidase subunit III
MTGSSVLGTNDVRRFADDSNFGGGKPPSAKRAKVGLLVLLGVISSLFFLFIVAFMIRSQVSDWEHLSAPWKPLASPWFLWINTAMLVMSSVFLQWARVAARNNRASQTVKGLLLSGIFAVAFLVGQFLVWRQFVSLGYFVSTNPANSFFYLLTGLHAMHLFGGLIAWIRTCLKAWKGVAIEQLSSSVELCAIYWHYLLGLWLLLLGLLTSSPETFAAIAEMCGLSAAV